MAYYKQPPKRKRGGFTRFILGIVGMTIFGVIMDQTKDTLR